MTKIRRAFLAHGFRGSPQIPKWYTWLKKELESRGWEVKVPQFPTPDHPKVLEWNSTIESELGGDFSDVVFIGHSLGGLAILRTLESHSESGKAAGVILVGVPAKDVRRPQIAEFFGDFNMPKIKENVNRENLHYVYSLDDPYVPLAHGRELLDKLGGTFHEFKKMGHFQDQEAFPEILELATVLA